MSMFVIVHRPAELVRACNDISVFLSFHREKHPVTDGESLIGMWLDPDEATTNLIVEASAMAGRLGKIRESVSLSGLWTLCWLDCAPACRLSLVDALIQVSSSKTGPSGRFVPVFPDDLPASEMDSEVYTMRRYAPFCVMPPIRQERGTGRILLPADYVASAEPRLP